MKLNEISKQTIKEYSFSFEIKKKKRNFAKRL